MSLVITLSLLTIYSVYLWTFGKAMYSAKEWPDLIAATGMLVISYAYAMVYTWNLRGFFPTRAFGELIMPLIELVYGRWL